MSVKKVCGRLLYRIMYKVLPEYGYRSHHYSQDGEDIILRSLFEEYSRDYKGFYVDIGAHHPFRFSNTAIFYKKGWRGINIEANPSLMNCFHRYRKRDVNVNCGVGAEIAEATFYLYKDSAISTFSSEMVKHYEESTGNKPIKEIKIPINTVAAILDKYLPEGQKIDFISIDTEGLDLDVLQSNDWEKYSPKFVLVEVGINKDRIFESMTAAGYIKIAKTLRTEIYTRNDV
ncbi:MAG: FkbM family methyltransferase [Dysgonamonadaceae bacterium]|nr:FkbM family methyltransferase [Dysgonamonadaceae bacterium]